MTPWKNCSKNTSMADRCHPNPIFHMKTMLVLILALIGSVSLQAESPQEGAKVIHDLIEAKDYKTLFTTRYSEWHKAAKEGVKEEDAVAKLSKMFEKKHEIMLGLYKELSAADFEMGEEIANVIDKLNNHSEYPQ